MADAQTLARILVIWPGPERGGCSCGCSCGGMSFLVEYETEAGPGRALLSPEEMTEQGIIEAYGTQRLVPVPRAGNAP